MYIFYFFFLLLGGLNFCLFVFLSSDLSSGTELGLILEGKLGAGGTAGQ